MARKSAAAAAAAQAQLSMMNPEDRDLTFGIRVSLILHLALAIGILVKTIVFPGEPMVFTPTLRVDLVGLPDILKQDMSKLPKLPDAEDLAKAMKKAETDAKKIKPEVVKPVPQKEVEKTKPEELVLKPKQAAPVDNAAREKKLKSSLDRIKALAKITESENQASAPPIIKGNRISKGTSLSGDAREAAQASYYDLLRDKFQDNWALPVWLARQKFSVQVLVFIDASGRMQSFRFTKPSGNAQFDEAVKRTLTASQPFPVPPSEIQGSLASNGILVGFPL